MEKREIDIWKFVRIMVECECSAKKSILVESFQKVWQDIDITLQNLAEKDLDSYATSMMESQVTLDNITAEHKREIVVICNRVIEKLKKSLSRIDEQSGKKNNQDNVLQTQNLLFEIQGLEQLIDEFC